MFCCLRLCYVSDLQNKSTLFNNNIFKQVYSSLCIVLNKKLRQDTGKTSSKIGVFMSLSTTLLNMKEEKRSKQTFTPRLKYGICIMAVSQSFTSAGERLFTFSVSL